MKNEALPSDTRYELPSLGVRPRDNLWIMSQMWVRGRFLFRPFLTTNLARRHRALRENAPPKREAFRREPSPKANPKVSADRRSPRRGRYGRCAQAGATRSPLPLAQSLSALARVIVVRANPVLAGLCRRVRHESAQARHENLYPLSSMARKCCRGFIERASRHEGLVDLNDLLLESQD